MEPSHLFCYPSGVPYRQTRPAFVKRTSRKRSCFSLDCDETVVHIADGNPVIRKDFKGVVFEQPA